MNSTPLAISIRESPGTTCVVEAVGELDMSSVPPLRATLLMALERGDLILDGAGIGFCDSAGLRTLVEVHRTAQTTARSFRLAAPSSAVIRVLELAGALAVLDICADVPSALKG